jgi:hypothetical protein
LAWLRDVSRLFFIHLESRRVSLAGITHHPDQAWIEPMARNATGESWGFLDQRQYVFAGSRLEVLLPIPGDAEGWGHKTNSTPGHEVQT